MRPRDEDRERLEQDLQTSAYQALLRKLQGEHLFFRGFRTWADVIAFMRNGVSTDPRKDEILRPIFEAHKDDEDSRWRAVLLAIFWPGLKSIHFQKRGWDQDSEERWQNIMWTFLQVLCRIDVKRRRDRLVQKVFNDTVHRLHDDYRRDWIRAERETPTDPEDLPTLAGATEGIDPEWIDLRAAHRLELGGLVGQPSVPHAEINSGEASAPGEAPGRKTSVGPSQFRFQGNPNTTPDPRFGCMPFGVVHRFTA